MKHDAEILYERLNHANPDRIMALGYAAVTDEAGSLIKSVTQIHTDDKVNVTFADGKRKMQVLK